MIDANCTTLVSCKPLSHKNSSKDARRHGMTEQDLFMDPSLQQPRNIDDA